MKRLKNEKGVITIITLVTVLFMVSFLISSYVTVANKLKTQKEIVAETREIYRPKTTMEEIYNSYFSNDNLIPIYTIEQFLAIGDNEQYNINGKIYEFSNNENVVYVLKNDLEINQEELNLEENWTPMYKDQTFLGKFDCGGYTLKIATLNGDKIIYNGYAETLQTNRTEVALTNLVEGKLVDYKIYGNSIQEGTSPIQIKDVGDLITDEMDINYGKYLIPVSLKSNGKNLLNKNQLIDGYIKSDGTVATVNWYKCTDFIEISGDYLVYSNCATTLSTDRYYAFYDENRNFISGQIQQTDEQGSSSYTVRIPDGAKYFRCNVSPGKIDTAMVELGTVSSEYEDYIEPVTTYIYLDEPLRKIGEKADYIDFKNKQIVRNVGVIDNTGTLSIEDSYQELEAPNVQSIELPEILTYEGTNIIKIDTEVEPSKITVSYKLKKS